ncbi:MULTISPECIES: aminotransferase A [Bacillaceae]|uniref:aminotransferase A n=1 Tax=Bacillaceae TaxID=186817 RepID=UPI001C57A2B3|nr:aminotransferase A [Rossellomorea sp. YZS02]MBW3114078.1 aminotransferase A [Bacillus sp. MCCB 382]MDX8342891.1 aminotransferase A [Rossellomorea sp. YZS02]
MEQHINPLVRDIQISGIRRFFNMVEGIDDMISLTIGQPDFPTPQHIKDAGKKAIDDNFTSYTHNAGFLELREAAASFVKEKYNIHYDPRAEVIVTNGASQGIDVILRTILCEGDDCLIPGPVYPGYEPIIKLCGANPVHVDITQNEFKLDAALIEKSLTPSTKCIIIPYPSNPTGVSLSKEELKEIADLLRNREIFVLADEIYSELTYDGAHHSIAEYLREQTIVINGLSKSHSMTGWRIGLVFAPETISSHLLKVHQYNVSCASSISQKAAYEALTKGKNDAMEMKDEYRKRRDYVYERLVQMGFEGVVQPQGAFYFFVKIPDELRLSSLDFSLALAKEKKVAVVPGDAFSKLGEGYFRLSYACSMEQLTEGLNRLQAFIQR